MAQLNEFDDSARTAHFLPPDWWQRRSAVSILLQRFSNHIVPLLVAGEVNNAIQHNVYSGLLLEHNQTLVWLTAGHVIDELKQLLSSSTFKPSVMAWLDEFEKENAENIRLHRTDMPTKSWRTNGLDIGAIIPSVLDAGNLRKNKKVVPVNARIWKNLSQANPEGYYAIGFPRPWSTHSQKLLPNRKILHSVKADLACLPLKEVTPPPEFADNPIWSDPTAFYGKILPFTDDANFQVDDVKGMSGGPILSVERESNGGIVYRLVGIIQ